MCVDVTWQHTKLTRDRHPWTRLDSNPHFQKASGCRHARWNPRPLGSASKYSVGKIYASGLARILCNQKRIKICPQISAYSYWITLYTHIDRVCHEYTGHWVTATWLAHTYGTDYIKRQISWQDDSLVTPNFIIRSYDIGSVSQWWDELLSLVKPYCRVC